MTRLDQNPEEQVNLIVRSRFPSEMITSTVIRKKANFKMGVSRKQSTPNFAKNKHFLPHTCAFPLVEAISSCGSHYMV